MLHPQPPLLLLDAEAPVLAVADLDLVRSGPALSQPHQQALTIKSVFSSRGSKMLPRMFLNHGEKIMLPGPVLSVASDKTLPRISLENLCLRQTFSPREY